MANPENPESLVQFNPTQKKLVIDSYSSVPKDADNVCVCERT